jgi:hypothetical protein
MLHLQRILGVVVHVCNLNTQEVEAGLGVQGHLGLQSEFLSQNNNNKKKKKARDIGQW